MFAKINTDLTISGEFIIKGKTVRALYILPVLFLRKEREQDGAPDGFAAGAG